MNKNNFPIFSNNKDKPIIYLDSASTSQKPKILSKSLSYFYGNLNSNIGRSSYKLSALAQESYENARANIADFFNSDPEKITFTLGATHSINVCSHILYDKLKTNSKIVLSILEHHANILPWQKIAKEKNIELFYVENMEHLNNPDLFDEDFWSNVSLVCLPHVTNTTGQIIPIEKWIKICNEKNIYTVIDGSQAACSLKINLNALAPDFYVFSAHKLYGPMGLGVIFINSQIIKDAQPLILGGGIIEDVEKNAYFLIDDIRKFEAGTPNIANVYAFSEVLTWLKKQRWEKELLKTKKLFVYMEKKLLSLDYIVPFLEYDDIYKTHIFSFNIKNIHAHDVGTFLDEKNICVRVGKHCAHPLHSYLGISSSIRASLGVYNDKNDIDIFVEEIKNCYNFFN